MKRNLGISVGLVVLCGLVSMASATEVPLASFVQSGAGGANVLSYSAGLSAGTDATTLNVTDFANNTNYFDGDVTLTLTGLGDDGNTVLFGGVYVQYLESGTFTLTKGSEVLLAGDISSATIVGAVGNSSASVWTLDSAITYTDGTILDNAGYSDGDTGSFSWSLQIQNAGGAVVNGTSPNLQLQPFTALASGEFNITPEPMTMSLLALGGIGMVIRRRRRRVA